MRTLDEFNKKLDETISEYKYETPKEVYLSNEDVVEDLYEQICNEHSSTPDNSLPLLDKMRYIFNQSSDTLTHL